jgi:DNA-binding NarL/FixJ family response regulator
MRVIIADDSTLFRDGLARLLAAVDVEVVAQLDDGTGALESARQHHPDVAILDIRMPPTYTDEGLVVAEQLRAALPEVGVLVLSTYAETPLAQRLLSSGASGVGYLLKDRVTDVGHLHEALRRVIDGESVVDPDIVNGLLAATRRNALKDQLSVREMDVLRAMAEGRSNAGIAAKLHLSERTVENYANKIFTKLGLSQEKDDNRRVLAVLSWLREHPAGVPD